MSDDKALPYVVWRRDYDTFNTGEWGEDKRFAHLEVAEMYEKSLAGWGTDTRIEGPHVEDNSAKDWQYMTKAEFDQTYVFSYGQVFRKDSVYGQEILARRAEEEKRIREYEEAQALKQVGKKRLP